MLALLNMNDVKKAAFSLITIFLLLVAMSGRYFDVQPKHAEKKTDSDHTQKDTNNKTQKASIDFYTVIVQVGQVVFHSDFIFEFELPSITNQKVHSIIETALNFTEYNRTLFRMIISPNAP